jgi:predicted nucleic-acid-binding protein
MGRLPGIPRATGPHALDDGRPEEHRGWPQERGARVKVGLDTSVVLRLLVGQPADQRARAVAFLDELARRGDDPVVSDLVVAETYFALQHHYGVSKAQALSALCRLFEDGEIKPHGAAATVLATRALASAKPGFVDRLIHRAYIADGQSRMATFERAASKLGSVIVLGR